MRPDITPGAVFPDYELPEETRTLRRLSEIQGDDPMILTLARGHYRDYSSFHGWSARTAEVAPR
jgi:hypothetical protein